MKAASASGCEKVRMHWRSCLRRGDRHAGQRRRERAIEADGLAVQERRLQNRFDKRSKLIRMTKALGKGDIADQVRLDRVWAWARRGVRIGPGAMAQARTPISAKSRAIVNVMPTMPDLAAA